MCTPALPWLEGICIVAQGIGPLTGRIVTHSQRFPTGAADLYIDGWPEGDKTRILDALDERCVVIESYGPIYRGGPRVEQWVDAWFGEGKPGGSVGDYVLSGG
jgi:hypothetical protein